MSRKMLKGGNKNEIDRAVDFFTKTEVFTQKSKETAKLKFDALRNPINKDFVDDKVKDAINIAFKAVRIYDLNTEFTDDKQAEQFVENKLNPTSLTLPPAPVDSALESELELEAELEEGDGERQAAAPPVVPVARQPEKLSDIDLNGIGFTIDENGTFTPNPDRTPDVGENQKKFIISKSSDINKALGEADIRKRVDQGAITNYNDAMKNATQYLEPEFKFTEIQGGKRTRRRRSKTRSRRTKNNRKKLYKR